MCPHMVTQALGRSQPEPGSGLGALGSSCNEGTRAEGAGRQDGCVGTGQEEEEEGLGGEGKEGGEGRLRSSEERRGRGVVALTPAFGASLLFPSVLGWLTPGCVVWALLLLPPSRLLGSLPFLWDRGRE